MYIRATHIVYVNVCVNKGYETVHHHTSYSGLFPAYVVFI